MYEWNSKLYIKNLFITCSAIMYNHANCKIIDSMATTTFTAADDSERCDVDCCFKNSFPPVYTN